MTRWRKDDRHSEGRAEPVHLLPRPPAGTPRGRDPRPAASRAHRRRPGARAAGRARRRPGRLGSRAPSPARRDGTRRPLRRRGGAAAWSVRVEQALHGVGDEAHDRGRSSRVVIWSDSARRGAARPAARRKKSRSTSRWVRAYTGFRNSTTASATTTAGTSCDMPSPRLDEGEVRQRDGARVREPRPARDGRVDGAHADHRAQVEEVVADHRVGDGERGTGS